MKIKHPVDEDNDVHSTTVSILRHLSVIDDSIGDIESGEILKLASETYLNLDQVKEACRDLTGDDYLSNTVDPDNPHGYNIYKSAESLVGVAVDEFVGFCVEELRLKALVDFFQSSYSSAVLRERQDVKVRFEISSEGVTISSVFANIEKHKDELMMDDYGVSQTSLEQVFNMHAAQAEKDKQDVIEYDYTVIRNTRRVLKSAFKFLGSICKLC